MRGAKFYGVGVILVVCTVALLLVSWGSASAQSGEFAPGRILVKFKAGANVAELHAANKTKTTKIIPRINVHVVSIPPGQGVQKMVERFKKMRNVEYAEPDYIAYADSVPNDTYFDKQWGMHNTGQTGGTPDADIDAPEAWDITTGGADVIAILDTGIDKDHEDLGGKVIHEANFSTSSTSDDIYGHGTHVAGIAAAVANNGIGVAGVGCNCRLMNIKVLSDTGSGTYSGIADGIIYAAENGAKVINMSLGGPNGSPTLENAVNSAWGAGVVVVASAGNDPDEVPNYPAYYENCIAVAATDHNDNMASFSTHGNWVDVAAPGVSIYSTTLPYKYRGKIVHYGYKSGTSMSAPHVAGLAGLVWSTSYGTSNVNVRNRIESTADAIPDTGSLWGRVNAYKAVTPPDDAVPTVNITNPDDSVTVSGEITIVADASDDVGVNQVDFYIGGVWLADDTTLPYSCSWGTTTVLDGSHTITATATDTIGQTASDTITVNVDNVDNPPEIEITSPDDGAIVSGVIDITADASDDKDVSKVDFYINGVWLADDTTSPYSCSWDTTTVSDGLHTITATATDTIGQTASHTIGVTVDNTPPDRVTGLTVTTVSSSQLDLLWDDNPETDLVDHYNVYRSDVSEGPIASPTTNSYSDTGLEASTTYYYVVTAVDTAENEGVASPASGTTSETGVAKMHVASIEMGCRKIGRNYKISTTVLIVDATDVPVEGAVVYLDLTSPTGVTSGSGLTGPDGIVTFVSEPTKITGTYTSTVTDVLKDDWSYGPNANVETSDTLPVP